MTPELLLDFNSDKGCHIDKAIEVFLDMKKAAVYERLAGFVFNDRIVRYTWKDTHESLFNKWEEV